MQLAELALPEAPAPTVEPPPPPPEPQRPAPRTPVEPPPPKKTVEQPKSKKISVHKKDDAPVAPVPEPPLAPVVPEAPVTPAPEQHGPQPQRFGGVAAYKADHVDQRPSIARRVSPEYPLKARRMEVEGEVMVQLVVDKAGQPQVCSVLAAAPAGYFEDAALEAAAKMRFIPGKIQGQPVNTMIVLPFTFRLR
ncbi:TonB family protein [Desulfobulbus sp.]|uniref:energy transducer TonB n=1 Tax=Desulfobulbus sp. TaxID=895 RepID=UPI00286F836E|nr:TonB family protein [Desulfobulbus sp.]